MGADKLAKNTANATKSISPNCLPKHKCSGFQWKKASLGVCSPCFCICCILTWFTVALKWNCFDVFTSTIFKICNKYTVGFLQRFDTSFGVKVMVKIKLISNPMGPGHVVLAVQWIRLRKYYQLILFQNKKYWAAKQQISWVIAPGGFSSLTFDQVVPYYLERHLHFASIKLCQSSWMWYRFSC